MTASFPKLQNIVRRVEGMFALAEQLEVRLAKVRGRRAESLLAVVVAMLTVLSHSPFAAVQAAQSNTISPVFELRKGERFFRIDGVPAFVLGRNSVGVTPEAFAAHFQHASAAGERFMRIHFTYSPPGEKPGEIHPDMLKSWDAVLDAAETNHLVVLPVLGIWSDWNDGSHGDTWHHWEGSSFNATFGGPAKRPSELLDDTPCRQLWFKRLETLVKHWAPRRCIVGWETFSEVDLITDATEDRAVEFAARAAAVVRAADPAHRPTTISQAGVNAWPKLLGSDAVQIVQVHPYAAHPYGGNLDELILNSVRERLQTYRKPVLIGECGLDWALTRGTLDVAPGAEVGIRHAIWASVVSGAMSGRMLWWQDGWDQFEKADVCRHYEQAAATASAFVKGMDFTDFSPVACEAPGLMGAMLGNDRRLIGWFRDVRCVPPEWTLREVSGRELTLSGHAGTWKVEFVDTVSGKLVSTRTLAAKKNQLRIPLPNFEGAIALRLTSAVLVLPGDQSGVGELPVEAVELPPLRIQGKPARAHTQGLEIKSGNYYVTARRDDVQPRRALLLRTDARGRDWDVWDITPLDAGSSPTALNHPGGMQSDGDRLWIPLAESKWKGSSRIRAFRMADLVVGQPLKAEVDFPVNDHIGAVAVSADRRIVFGANWDTEAVYVWDFDGRLQQTLSGPDLERRGLGVGSSTDHPAGLAVQDWKMVGDRLVASGLFRGAGDVPGAPQSRLMSFGDFTGPGFQCQAIPLPKQDGTELAREAMAISEGVVHFLPDDLGDSNRIFRVSFTNLMKRSVSPKPGLSQTR